jgi:methylated-DNA-[protein]-cysteine S-methyltransferase
MDEAQYFTIFNTRAGWIGILGSGHGLRRTTLPQRSENEVYLSLGNGTNGARSRPDYFQDLVEQYRLYFSGEPVGFTVNLDFAGATPFQKAVWQATGQIPYRETRSYTWVARKIGKPKAVRAVGQALGRNPLPIIVPCHRVVAADGGLGGYSGGLTAKKYLLKIENRSK